MEKNKLQHNNNSGFKTPKDYFSSLDETILTQIQLNKKITKSVFKTPKNYFESLENRVIPQLSKNQESKIISLIPKKTIIGITSIAATIVLLLNLNIFDKSISFDTIKTEDLENYMANQEFEILNLESEIIKDLDITSFLSEESISDVSLENYLYNSSDLEDFISE